MVKITGAGEDLPAFFGSCFESEGEQVLIVRFKFNGSAILQDAAVAVKKHSARKAPVGMPEVSCPG